MVKRTQNNNWMNSKTIRIPQAMERYNLGKDTIRKLAEDADAIIRYGRTVLIDCAKMDSYLESLRVNSSSK